MNDVPDYFETLLTAFHCVTMAAYLAGALACLVFRRASRFLIVVSTGFAVDFLVSAIELYRATTWQLYQPNLLIYLTFNLLSSLSKVAVVVGLGLALFDIRRKLAAVKGPVDELA